MGLSLWKKVHQSLLALGSRPEVRLDVAKKHLAEGRLQLALAEAKKVVAGRPVRGDIFVTAGDLLFQAGNLEEAAEAYQKGFQADASYGRAYRHYLMAMQELGRIVEAEQEMRDMELAHPGEAAPRNYVGVALYLRGQVDEAATTWSHLVRDYPRYSPAHSNLGMVLDLQGKLDQALVEYKLAIELNPADAIGAHNNIAEIYIGRGKLEEAIQHLKLATDLDSRLAAPWANLGHCYAALGRNADAVEAYEQALRRPPGVSSNDIRLEVLIALSKLYLGAHRLEAAEQRGLEAMERAPESSEACATMGQVRFHQGRYEEAVELYRRVLELNPLDLRSLMVYRSLALAYYKLGHFDKATAEYQRANAWQPCHIVAGSGRKRPNARRESAETSIARIKASLAVHPNDRELQRALAEAYFNMGCLEEAIEAYRAAQALDPENLELLCQLGMSYYANDQRLPALIAFSRAAELDPGHAPAHVGMGLIYLLRGSVDTAILKFEWAIAVDAEAADAQHYLGTAYRQKKELVKARAAFEAAVRLSPEYLPALNSLGQVYLETGELEKAVATFERALAVDPECLSALCAMGQAWKLRGDRTRAEAAWQRALTVNPHNPVAQAKLAAD